MRYALHNYIIPMLGFLVIFGLSVLGAPLVHSTYQNILIYFLLFTVLRDSWLREVEKNRL